MILTKVLVLFLCELFLFIGWTSAQFYSTTTTNLVLPPQCFAYTTVNDGSRNVNANGSTDCDTMFMSGSDWIRFVGESGTQLSTSPTSPNQCGTQVTGWYSGHMPSISETVTNGRVCFSWLNNVCHWSNTIGVTNCGSFYIYQLTMPPVCAARYCTSTPNFLTTTTTLPPPILSPQCHNYTTIDDPSRSVNANSSSVNKKCDQNEPLFSTIKWFRFVGEGGTQIPTTATQPRQCSTDAGGWYSGNMPHLPDTTTNGTVCFSWERNTCWGSTKIQVTNCGSFYVYQLPKPSSCSLRYCTDTPTIPITSTTITTTAMSTTAIMTTTAAIFSSQCYNYTTIDDDTRNTEKPTGTNCDQNVFNSGQRWVRFVGAGGTQIPTSAVGHSRCGTQATGWYSGAMPMVFDTTTNGAMCFAWQSTTCQWSTAASVTNCGSYYVYQLSAPPICNARYCTTHASSASRTNWLTAGFTSVSNYIRSLFKKLTG